MYPQILQVRDDEGLKKPCQLSPVMHATLSMYGAAIELELIHHQENDILFTVSAVFKGIKFSRMFLSLKDCFTCPLQVLFSTYREQSPRLETETILYKPSLCLVCQADSSSQCSGPLTHRFSFPSRQLKDIFQVL